MSTCRSESEYQVLEQQLHWHLQRCTHTFSPGKAMRGLYLWSRPICASHLPLLLSKALGSKVARQTGLGWEDPGVCALGTY